MIRKPVIITVCLLVLSLYGFWLVHIETYPIEFQLEGKIDDCCCEGNLIKETNARIRPILKSLASSEFFKFFRVNLENECPFWAAELICTSPDKCGVCKCDDSQIPLPWRNQGKLTDKVSYVSEKYPDQGLEYLSRWFLEEEENENAVYVDLTVNPEQFTGYQGQRIWHVIYEENCFHGKDLSMCLEERMLYRIISGLHTSISTQLSWHYIDHARNNRRYPNVAMFFDKVGKYPDRIKNLYFAYSVVLRAINLASHHIKRFEYNTGKLEDDIKTEKSIYDLVNETMTLCAQPFNESEIFQNISTEEVKRQFITHLHNIYRIMDCVECEKCKVYGKMQTYGLATALKILFNEKLSGQKSISLTRNELIALVNTFIKLSSSIELVDAFYKRRYENTRGFAHIIALCVFLLMGFIWIALKAHKESQAKLKGKLTETFKHYKEKTE